MLTDEEIVELTDANMTQSEIVRAIREAVRLTAERCAEIGDSPSWSDNDDPAVPSTAKAYAAAIRERIKDKPRPPFDPNQGFRPI